MVRKQVAAALLGASLVLSMGSGMARAAPARDLCNGHSNSPDCSIPESPFALGLPMAGIAVLGGYIFVMRRRFTRGRGDEDED